ATGKHQPTAPNRREDQRHRHGSAEDSRSQIAHWGCDRTAWPERHRFKRPTVCAQRRFVLSAAVDVVENNTRETLLGPAPQAFDVQNARRLNGSRQAIHTASRSITRFLLTPGFSPVQSRKIENGVKTARVSGGGAPAKAGVNESGEDDSNAENGGRR